jgi:hypothetical protein
VCRKKTAKIIAPAASVGKLAAMNEVVLQDKGAAMSGRLANCKNYDKFAQQPEGQYSFCLDLMK